jgi:hypothetical protein
VAAIDLRRKSCLFGNMADRAHYGHLVRVTTPRLGGGSPMVQAYAAGYHKPSEAVEAVRNHLFAVGTDISVEHIRPMVQPEIDRLGLAELAVVEYDVPVEQL